MGVQPNIAAGLQIDLNHNLVVVDPGAGLVELFSPPYPGAPAATKSTLYVSTFNTGTVDWFAYPSGAYQHSISNGMQPNTVQGVAVLPAAKN
ncbi:MAG: hypothetical protein NVSMB31_13490 [Vulcanimicrobiaceae bacterium]